MIGFIKYKLFKWLWNDLCAKLGDCDDCPMSSIKGFGQCDKCENWVIDCYDVEDLMFKAGRRAWKVE